MDSDPLRLLTPECTQSDDCTPEEGSLNRGHAHRNAAYIYGLVPATPQVGNAVGTVDLPAALFSQSRGGGGVVDDMLRNRK